MKRSALDALDDQLLNKDIHELLYIIKKLIRLRNQTGHEHYADSVIYHIKQIKTHWSKHHIVVKNQQSIDQKSAHTVGCGDLSEAMEGHPKLKALYALLGSINIAAKTNSSPIIDALNFLKAIDLLRDQNLTGAIFFEIYEDLDNYRGNTYQEEYQKSFWQYLLFTQPDSLYLYIDQLYKLYKCDDVIPDPSLYGMLEYVMSIYSSEATPIEEQNLDINEKAKKHTRAAQALKTFIQALPYYYSDDRSLSQQINAYKQENQLTKKGDYDVPRYIKINTQSKKNANQFNLDVAIKQVKDSKKNVNLDNIKNPHIRKFLAIGHALSKALLNTTFPDSFRDLSNKVKSYSALKTNFDSLKNLTTSFNNLSDLLDGFLKSNKQHTHLIQLFKSAILELEPVINQWCINYAFDFIKTKDVQKEITAYIQSLVCMRGLITLSQYSGQPFYHQEESEEIHHHEPSDENHQGELTEHHLSKTLSSILDTLVKNKFLKWDTPIHDQWPYADEEEGELQTSCYWRDEISKIRCTVEIKSKWSFFPSSLSKNETITLNQLLTDTDQSISNVDITKVRNETYTCFPKYHPQLNDQKGVSNIYSAAEQEAINVILTRLSTENFSSEAKKIITIPKKAPVGIKKSKNCVKSFRTLRLKHSQKLSVSQTSYQKKLSQLEDILKKLDLTIEAMLRKDGDAADTYIRCETFAKACSLLSDGQKLYNDLINTPMGKNDNEALQPIGTYIQHQKPLFISQFQQTLETELTNTIAENKAVQSEVQAYCFLVILRDWLAERLFNLQQNDEQTKNLLYCIDNALLNTMDNNGAFIDWPLGDETLEASTFCQVLLQEIQEDNNLVTILSENNLLLLDIQKIQFGNGVQLPEKYKDKVADEYTFLSPYEKRNNVLITDPVPFAQFYDRLKGDVIRLAARNTIKKALGKQHVRFIQQSATNKEIVVFNESLANSKYRNILKHLYTVYQPPTAFLHSLKPNHPPGWDRNKSAILSYFNSFCSAYRKDYCYSYNFVIDNTEKLYTFLVKSLSFKRTLSSTVDKAGKNLSTGDKIVLNSAYRYSLKPLIDLFKSIDKPFLKAIIELDHLKDKNPKFKEQIKKVSLTLIELAKACSVDRKNYSNLLPLLVKYQKTFKSLRLASNNDNTIQQKDKSIPKLKSMNESIQIHIRERNHSRLLAQKCNALDAIAKKCKPLDINIERNINLLKETLKDLIQFDPCNNKTSVKELPSNYLDQLFELRKTLFENKTNKHKITAIDATIKREYNTFLHDFQSVIIENYNNFFMTNSVSPFKEEINASYSILILRHEIDQLIEQDHNKSLASDFLISIRDKITKSIRNDFPSHWPITNDQLKKSKFFCTLWDEIKRDFRAAVKNEDIPKNIQTILEEGNIDKLLANYNNTEFFINAFKNKTFFDQESVTLEAFNNSIYREVSHFVKPYINRRVNNLTKEKEEDFERWEKHAKALVQNPPKVKIDESTEEETNDAAASNEANADSPYQSIDDEQKNKSPAVVGQSTTKWPWVFLLASIIFIGGNITAGAMIFEAYDISIISKMDTQKALQGSVVFGLGAILLLLSIGIISVKLYSHYKTEAQANNHQVPLRHQSQ